MKEFKNIQLKDIDLKFEGESRKFSGYASVFGGNDSYGDTVMPGAFTKTLAAYGMPKMLLRPPVGTSYREVDLGRRGRKGPAC